MPAFRTLILMGQLGAYTFLSGGILALYYRFGPMSILIGGAAFCGVFCCFLGPWLGAWRLVCGTRRCAYSWGKLCWTQPRANFDLKLPVVDAQLASQAELNSPPEPPLGAPAQSPVAPSSMPESVEVKITNA